MPPCPPPIKSKKKLFFVLGLIQCYFWNKLFNTVFDQWMLQLVCNLGKQKVMLPTLNFYDSIARNFCTAKVDMWRFPQNVLSKTSVLMIVAPYQLKLLFPYICHNVFHCWIFPMSGYGFWNCFQLWCLLAGARVVVSNIWFVVLWNF